MTTMDQITTKDYDKNATGPQPCDCCGREIKGTPKFWIEVVGWGGKVASVDHGADETSLGFFPLGPECRKKYPAEFVHKEAGK